MNSGQTYNVTAQRRLIIITITKRHNLIIIIIITYYIDLRLSIKNNMFAGTRTTSLAHGYVVINNWTIIILRIAHTMISAKVRPLSMLTCLYIIIYNTYTYKSHSHKIPNKHDLLSVITIILCFSCKII